MIFHFGFELPKPELALLDEQTPDLTSEEIRILRDQIRRNSALVSEYVERLDLLVNKEKYPQKAEFIDRIRRRLEVLMEENDTFRKVLWQHFSKTDIKIRFGTKI